MLNRARKLQRLFDQYCTTHQYVQFKLDQEEWRQVDYLLSITKPFFDATNILSKTQDVSVHHVFSIYNRMFTHLEEAEEKLKYKAIPWKKRMLWALQGAKEKLLKYYHATGTESFGQVHAIATILCPSKKLRYFEGDNWKGKDKDGQPIDFTKIYQDALQKEFIKYQQRFVPQVSPGDIDAAQGATENPLDSWVDSQPTVMAEVEQPEDELTRYLAKGKQFLSTMLY
jgi:hypothetical protein